MVASKYRPPTVVISSLDLRSPIGNRLPGRPADELDGGCRGAETPRRPIRVLAQQLVL